MKTSLRYTVVSLNATNAAPDNEVDFDHVQLDAQAIPEPGAFLLVGAGLAVLQRRRRR